MFTVTSLVICPMTIPYISIIMVSCNFRSIINIMSLPLLLVMSFNENNSSDVQTQSNIFIEIG